MPLVIFKREKAIAHSLEKNHLWVTSKPLESWSDWWDQLAVRSGSFPRNYWDKRVKQRVYKSFGSVESSYTVKLGIKTKSKFEERTVMEQITETL